MMGDVTGKGPGAAAITSLARCTMRTAAEYEDDPTAMLRRLNATLGSDPERRQICTAVCVGVHPPADGAPGVGLQVVCAGHPSPLLVAADGEVRPVGRPGTLLGAFAEGPLDNRRRPARRGRRARPLHRRGHRHART